MCGERGETAIKYSKTSIKTLVEQGECCSNVRMLASVLTSIGESSFSSCRLVLLEVVLKTVQEFSDTGSCLYASREQGYCNDDSDPFKLQDQ